MNCFSSLPFWKDQSSILRWARLRLTIKFIIVKIDKGKPVSKNDQIWLSSPAKRHCLKVGCWAGLPVFIGHSQPIESRIKLTDSNAKIYFKVFNTVFITVYHRVARKFLITYLTAAIIVARAVHWRLLNTEDPNGSSQQSNWAKLSLGFNELKFN